MAIRAAVVMAIVAVVAIKTVVVIVTFVAASQSFRTRTGYRYKERMSG